MSSWSILNMRMFLKFFNRTSFFRGASFNRYTFGFSFMTGGIVLNPVLKGTPRNQIEEDPSAPSDRIKFISRHKLSARFMKDRLVAAKTGSWTTHAAGTMSAGMGGTER